MNRIIIVLVTLFSCVFGNIYASGLQNISVSPFSFLNQLPSNDMACIFQDREGLIWLGTADGLCRYDGYNVHVFRSGSRNSEVLSNNNVRSIAETHEGKLLVGTLKGISVFDKSTNRFSTLKLSDDLSNYEVRSIVVDKDGYCWIGSYKKLMRLSPDLKSLKTYDKVLPETSVNTVFMDKAGSIWVGFWDKGLYLYDKGKDTFTRMPSIGKNNNPFRLFQDKTGTYWISTWGEGMFTMSRNKHNTIIQPVRLTHSDYKSKNLETIFGFTQDPFNNYLWMVGLDGMTVASIGNDKSLNIIDMIRQTTGMDRCFNSIMSDRTNNIWLASGSVGGYMLNLSESGSSVLPFPSITAQTNGLSLGITNVFEDSHHTFWVCQDRWGLGWYNPTLRSLHFYKDVPALAQDKFLADIAAIMPASSNRNEVWVAPRFTHSIYVFTTSSSIPSLKSKIDLNRVSGGNPIAFYRDKRGFVWCAAQGGILTISPSGALKMIKKGLSDLTTITGDNNGHIWVGTSSNGLYRLTPVFHGDAYTLQSIANFSAGNNKLPGNGIEALSFDSRHNYLWIGTMEGRVLCLTTNENKITDYSETFSGGITAAVQNINVDKFGHVWVSTAKNIVEYNPEDKSSRYYPVPEDAGMTSYIKGAVGYNDNDLIYYGGRGGIAYFNVRANSLSSSTTTPVVVTDLKVKGVSILDGTLSDDYRIDTHEHSLILGSDARNIEIYFSTLNYTHPERIQYAYRIRELNKDWSYTQGNFPRAYFNELSKGTYTLEVRATDENGKWSDKTETYKIVRLPAWYETWWAYTVYLLAILAAGYYAYRTVKHRLTLKNELRIAKIENEKNEELTQAKLRYFTNVSHDFLTPISIISCLIDDIGMTYKTPIPQLERMRISLRRLKHLIQQVLDFRKLENGKMTLQVSQDNLEIFLRKVSQDNFEPLMDRKHIHLKLDLEPDIAGSWFDEDKVEKIVYNLLSNAYKYTEDGGSVTVSLSFKAQDGHRLAILSVKDTGHGLSKEDADHIFTRFYSANTNKAIESNGIGLALVKELVDLHHATIRVESEIGKGADFILTLPTDPESYSDTERAASGDMKGALNLELPTLPSGAPTTTTLEKADRNEDSSEKRCMLLVDDNQDLLDVMSRIFSVHYHVLLAHNGKEGLETVSNNAVDIIISDVMMPEMDGLTFCRRLKSDIATSHIPVILLTAKNSSEDRVECYEAGADGYVAKPFELNVLEARIENFLNRKRGQQVEYKTNPNKETSSLQVSPLDQAFLDKITKILDVNMEKSNDIDMELVTTEIGMSKSSLYRKMKSITGLSPIEFIKNHRLKRAYKLLEEGAESVADVAYSSGFSNPKYFATCFKEEFGMTPSEFIKKQ